MTKASELMSYYQMGPFPVRNRIIMAPMTRNRAGEGNVPTDLNATYYAQRASAGFIISEATQISAQGVGYPNTPGIHTDAQVAGWKKVTDRVHAQEGLIFLQLWHVGRISHPDFHNGELPVGPSAIRPEGQAFTHEGFKDFVTPRALRREEIPGIIQDYIRATEMAKAAGFDGVEIHAANGYLLDQFLQDNANQRTDEYGGSVANRARLLLEVTKNVIGVLGRDRVGVRLSPGGTFNDMADSDPMATFNHVVRELDRLQPLYLHLVEADRQTSPFKEGVAAHFRQMFRRTLITCGNYDLASGQAAVENDDADLVAYARLFLANPDLPERFAQEAELNEPNPDTFYGGDEAGYTDYPTLAVEAEQA